jgi:polysaccharide export outer membrane protein
VPQFPKVHGLIALVAAAALSACATTTPNPDLPQGAAAYEVIPAKAPTLENYILVPGDTLAVDVFGEAALSKSQLLVDNAGFVQLPLAGQIKAAGLTVGGLSNAITTSLGGRYLVDPEVSVSVVQPAKRYVSVEGEVKAPGVYEIDTDFTLLSAIARAQSPTDTARLNEVLVFRTINDRRMVARFNLKDIRGGIAPDPEIMNGDVVTIGRSAVRAAWQDILRAAPIFNAFVVLGNN